MKKILASVAVLGWLAVGAISCVSNDERDVQASRDLCVGCGEWYGTDACCDPDAARCGECGMIAGSPGCCK